MKHGKYKWQFVYAPKPSVVFTGSVFTKLTLVQDFFLKTSCAEFHEKKRDDLALFINLTFINPCIVNTTNEMQLCRLIYYS
jgi:hypothetical protein